MLTKIGARVQPLAPSKWMIGFSMPMLGSWIAVAARSKVDLFIGPYFWTFVYLLVWGVGLFVWGVMTTPVYAAKNRIGTALSIVMEELALGVAFFFLFSALVGD